MTQTCPTCGARFDISDDVLRYTKDVPTGDITAAITGRLTCQECRHKEKGEK